MKAEDGKCPICAETSPLDPEENYVHPKITYKIQDRTYTQHRWESYKYICNDCGYAYQIYGATYRVTVGGRIYNFNAAWPIDDNAGDFDRHRYDEGMDYYEKELLKVKKAIHDARKAHVTKLYKLGDLYVGFVDAIKKNPYDMTTRKILADYLEEKGYDDDALMHRNWTEEKQKSEEWLKEFAKQHTVSYQDLIVAGHIWTDRNEDYDMYVQLGKESLRDTTSKEEIDKYWECWQLITGEWSTKATDNPFGCTC